MLGHLPKKRLGQNFLFDESIIYRIIDVIAPQKSDRLVEIGPGMGAITLPLLPLVGQLAAIELDRDVVPLLEAKATHLGKLVIYQQDALEFDLSQLATDKRSLRVVGNLPYNISTPLLFHLFDQQALIKDMHFMLQKEVAQRLAAAPGSKQYGRLSIMAQYHCNIELLFEVSPYSFNPPPKVDSCFIRLIPKEKPTVAALDPKMFEQVVKQAFSHRRKTLANALKGLVTKEQLALLNIDPHLRPEQLALDSYVIISNSLSHPSEH